MNIDTALRIEEVRTHYEDFKYRTPIKFGGVALDRVTLLNVHVTATSRSGRRAVGFGSMPLGNVWSFPSRVLSYDQTLAAMREVAESIAALMRKCRETAHPIDLTWMLEPAFFDGAKDVSKKLQLAEPIPPLCTLVVASPFDAALHDALGKLNDLNAYETYGRPFLPRNLDHY